MTKSNRKEIQPILSPFAQAAVSLDEEMKEFENLSEEFERLQFGTEKGIKKGAEIINELTTCRLNLEARMRDLVVCLEQARERNEHAEKLVAERMGIYQSKQGEVQRLQERFKTLGQSVSQLNQMIGNLRMSSSSTLSKADESELRQKLERAMAPLATLVDEAKSLVQDARGAQMKTLERNADNLRQTLQAAQNKLILIGERSRVVH